MVFMSMAKLKCCYCSIMETVLQLYESNPDYPSHFQKFLDYCLDTFEANFLANDYLFAAVYFLILESGFTPDEFYGDDDSITFDVKKLRSISCYPSEQVARMRNCNPSKCFIYSIPIYLGETSYYECELQGVPSAEVNNHLIINFLSKNPHIVKSLCLNTEEYTEETNNFANHKVKLKNLKELSHLIKNKISTHVKDLILQNEEHGCHANLLHLPEEVQIKIVHYLQNDAASAQCLSSTCSYFYNMISHDTKLWEHICFKEFHGRDLNEAMNAIAHITDDNDSNFFRSVFFYLKKKERRGF